MRQDRGVKASDLHVSPEAWRRWRWSLPSSLAGMCTHEVARPNPCIICLIFWILEGHQMTTSGVESHPGQSLDWTLEVLRWKGLKSHRQRPVISTNSPHQFCYQLLDALDPWNPAPQKYILLCTRGTNFCYVPNQWVVDSAAAIVL